MIQKRNFEILLVEDDPGDIRLTQEAFKEGKLNNNIHTVMDGVEAIKFLTREGEYSGVPRPDLILLDLNLPKKDGREVLHFVKSNAELLTIPIIILSTSSATNDIEGAYKLYANSYITKPVDFDSFISVIKSIEDFWLNLALLPSRY